MADSWLVPPDALRAVLTVLEDAFPGVHVSAKVPITRPEQFMYVSQIGATQPNPNTDKPRILVECWAPIKKTARDMAYTAGTALRNAAGSCVDDVFIRCWDNQQGPIDFPDPMVSDQERWQIFGDLSISTVTVVSAGS